MFGCVILNVSAKRLKGKFKIDTIKRAIITVQAVKYRPEGSIGYIRLISFSEQANKGVKEATENLVKKNSKRSS